MESDPKPETPARGADLTQPDALRPKVPAEPADVPEALHGALRFLFGSELPDADSGALEPDQIGPYRIDGVIGRGGQGMVYRAHDFRLDRPVALKVLSGVESLAPEARRRFEREAKVASRLNDPHICAVYCLRHRHP
jgi:serine/threonine protein kinase